MIVSVINHSAMPDDEIQRAISAINRQINEHFKPYWSMGASLRLEGPLTEDPDLRLMAASTRGDAILYIEDTFQTGDPLGYHFRNFMGIPYGFVFTDLAAALGEPWQVTLSHEALEMVADPEANLLVMGPHPNTPNRDIFHWYEVCDAVQAEVYEIDGVPVSNFLLPLYFTSGEDPGGRNDFLGTKGNALASFGINPGGYVGFYDPTLDDHDQVFADDASRARAAIKAQYGLARRSNRYKDRRQVIESAKKAQKGGRSRSPAAAKGSRAATGPKKARGSKKPTGTRKARRVTACA